MLNLSQNPKHQQQHRPLKLSAVGHSDPTSTSSSSSTSMASPVPVIPSCHCDFVVKRSTKASQLESCDSSRASWLPALGQRMRRKRSPWSQRTKGLTKGYERMTSWLSWQAKNVNKPSVFEGWHMMKSGIKDYKSSWIEVSDSRKNDRGWNGWTESFGGSSHSQNRNSVWQTPDPIQPP